MQSNNKGKEPIKEGIPREEVNQPSEVQQSMEIEKLENDSKSSMSGVNDYLEKLSDDIDNKKTLETEIKNSYGGNNQIFNYSPDNNGATLLSSMDNMYKELKTETNNNKEDMQNMMKNFMEQIQTQFMNLTATLNATLQTSITEQNKRLEQLDTKIANKADSFQVQNLANVIDLNTVKPGDLDLAVNEVREELQQSQLNSAKSQDLLPLENGLTQQQNSIENTNQEVIQLTNKLTNLEKDFRNITQQAVENNAYTDNLTTVIKNEMAEKLQATRVDSKEAIQKLQDQLIAAHHMNGKTEENFVKNIQQFKETLEEHAIIQTQIQERIKSLETEQLNSEGNGEISSKITTLRNLYEDILNKYEELQTSVQHEQIKECLNELTNIKRKLNSIDHLAIDNVQEEYKLLFYSNSRSKKLFKAEIDPNTLAVTITPKNEKCSRIINTLINEKYLMDTNFNYPTEEISLSNISKFRSRSFIGHSTLDDREEEQDKRIDNKLKEQEDKFNRKIDSIKENSARASSSHISNYNDDVTSKFNARFKNKEAKENYFDMKFYRTKVYNTPEDVNKERFQQLLQETKPDFSKGSKCEQYYYFKMYPRIYNTRSSPVVSFRPTDFQDRTARSQEQISQFRSLFTVPAPRYKGKSNGYGFLLNLKSYLQTYCPSISEIQVRDAILARGGKDVKNWYYYNIYYYLLFITLFNILFNTSLNTSFNTLI
ncbi:hypothetical protein BCR36DRAFT_369737 [Piromyces finnis]|uniref:Uncharacterized protein n=1 Tax=Piromyces finnis TaxID=1754191 RepID=A0A1Y1VCF0_9FUNG|nr:hypothetical protein BCR36DRAFT_369737 [Piromyces finnis]|eukprot:ORX51829.1 hypothetical protein BCR36DRAFT_369737 [Piromyces finnis]